MIYSTICVSNMDEALGYYRDIIGMTVKSDTRLKGKSYDNLYGLKGVDARRAVLGFQESGDIHLIQHYAHRGWPVSKAMTQYDYCYIHMDFASRSLEHIYRDFQKKGVTVNCPMQNEQTQQRKSISFKAPDFVQLETHDWAMKHPWIKAERPEKGFYAFVHTALSVRDLNQTLHFYRDLLDMQLIRTSHLQGDRFESMDCLKKGAIAQNAVVRGKEGPEIQFLWHYAGVHHQQGKPIGITMQQCDYAIVNVGLKTDDIEGLHRLLRKEGTVVNCEIQSTAGGIRAFSFRDPDGNFLIVES